MSGTAGPQATRETEGAEARTQPPYHGMGLLSVRDPPDTRDNNDDNDNNAQTVPGGHDERQESLSCSDAVCQRDEVLVQFESILSQLTVQEHQDLLSQALKLRIDSEERLMAITNLVYEKAVAEQRCAEVCATFCHHLQKLPKVRLPFPETKSAESDSSSHVGKMKPTSNFRERNFRGLLLTKCQREFENIPKEGESLENLKQKVDKAVRTNRPEEEVKARREELHQATSQARHRCVGNVVFVAQLFRKTILTENIMHDCVYLLLKRGTDLSMECLTKLLEGAGKDMDHPKAKKRMDQYFVQLEKMVADIRPPPGDTVAVATETLLSNRIKSLVVDLLELRLNGWEKRHIHVQNQPTTLGAIH